MAKQSSRGGGATKQELDESVFPSVAADDEGLEIAAQAAEAQHREAEARLLPLAAERGLAVIANRPFRRGALIDTLATRPLPDWAHELDAASWPQFLLKFIVSHPAVTCAIPATSRVEHMTENMGAAYGRMPDAQMRRRMADVVADL